MFVLTVDQQDSTRRGDKVPELLERLGSRTDLLDGVELPFERTVGDEVQAVISAPETVLALVLEILRIGGWRTGLGIGAVNLPLPSHSREASGVAFVRARQAIDRAKSRTTAVPLTLNGDRSVRVAEAEALLRLLGAIVERRSPQGWAVVDLLSPGPNRVGSAVAVTQREVSRILGITDQAVSQRLRAAMWAEERAAWPLATRLLTEADADLDRTTEARQP